jgi:hypothetical protein
MQQNMMQQQNLMMPNLQLTPIQQDLLNNILMQPNLLSLANQPMMGPTPHTDRSFMSAQMPQTPMHGAPQGQMFSSMSQKQMPQR